MPNSPVAVLADGNVPLAAFLPSDRAFRRLAHSLTGKWYHSEKKVFIKLAGTRGVDPIESVMLYHVVPAQRSPIGRLSRPIGHGISRVLMPADL